ncbi:MAG: penicillin-binding protein activator LpoB [Verrucomicrobia bacterium]|nr:penicillin-binding protein activator LpoB [Verrucomicrobiota bacterium]
MKHLFHTSLKFCSGSIVCSLLLGCASTGVKNPSGVPVTEMKADERGFVAGTGVESQDLVAVTDKMARKILSIDQIVKAQGTPKVYLLPVENNTRFPINRDLFLDRIRAQLNERATGKVRFLARTASADGSPQRIMQALERERDLKESGAVTSNAGQPAAQFSGADFLLTGKLGSLTTRTSRGVSDYILYTFQLIDVRTTEIVWEGSEEIKKQGLEDAAYR